MQKEYEELNKKHIATWWQRGFGFFIDILILAIIGTIIFELFLKTKTPIVNPNDENVSYVMIVYNKTALRWIMLVITILYYILMETYLGRTLGKYITGTVVLNVKTNQKVQDDTSIIIRTFVRMIPLEWISFFAIRPTGLHDTVSNTYVASLRGLNNSPSLLKKNYFIDQVDSFKNTVHLGYLRILLIVSMGISISVGIHYYGQVNTYTDENYQLERLITFLCATIFGFIIFWLIVKLIIWVIAGFKKK